jgi:hypothetical protein
MDNLFLSIILVTATCYVFYEVGYLVANLLFGEGEDWSVNFLAQTVIMRFGLVVTGTMSVIAHGIWQGTMVALFGWVLFFVMDIAVRRICKSL